MATFSASVGFGNTFGHDKDSVRPSFTPCNRVPVPPPEKDTATVAAFGDTRPSDVKASVGSVAVQTPSRSIRTGVPYRFTDHVPSGSAHVSDDSVRAETSSYG
ncbi:hypothetical protein [Streptomyces griseoluteus]|uniref:hypothetical protein n=1 Tax=Streptomyces griseoluteus TaxID=29306 RepID=UPI003674983C